MSMALAACVYCLTFLSPGDPTFSFSHTSSQPCTNIIIFNPLYQHPFNLPGSRQSLEL